MNGSIGKKVATMASRCGRVDIYSVGDTYQVWSVETRADRNVHRKEASVATIEAAEAVAQAAAQRKVMAW